MNAPQARQIRIEVSETIWIGQIETVSRAEAKAKAGGVGVGWLSIIEMC